MNKRRINPFSGVQKVAERCGVYFEGYANKIDAKEREEKLKQFGKVSSQLTRRIKRSLQS